MVRNLIIPLVSIPEDGDFVVEESFSEAELRPEHAESLGLSAITIRGSVSSVSTEYLFNGSISATFDGRCDRCLEAAKVVHEQPITWLLERGRLPLPDHGLGADETLDLALGSDDADDAFPEAENQPTVRVFEGNEIDLGPLVWEELSFVAPGKMVCSEDCEGLCNSCGANLNKGACTCNENNERADSAFAGLKDLYPDLPTESPEE